MLFKCWRPPGKERKERARRERTKRESRGTITPTTQ